MIGKPFPCEFVRTNKKHADAKDQEFGVIFELWRLDFMVNSASSQTVSYCDVVVTDLGHLPPTGSTHWLLIKRRVYCTSGRTALILKNIGFFACYVYADIFVHQTREPAKYDLADFFR